MTGVALLIPDPAAAIGGVPGWAPSAGHLLLFLVLAFLLARSLRASSRPRPLVTAFGVAFCYGLVLELLQIPIAGRGAEWLDVVLNGIGATAGAAGHGLAIGTGSCQNDDLDPDRRG